MLLFLQAAAPPKAPEQPVPYSHKKHLAMGLQCKNCHTNEDPGEMMGFPPVTTCMGCHKSVKTDSPHIKKLAAHAEEKSEPVWVRVYRIPSYVFFSHRAHTEAGAKCEKCHGPVKDRDVLAKEVDVSMGGCMSCHQQNKASNACNFCHEPR
ncbi:MAG: cytochrome c3 family protein [Bryobacteraceae bacterium]